MEGPDWWGPPKGPDWSGLIVAGVLFGLLMWAYALGHQVHRYDVKPHCECKEAK